MLTFENLTGDPALDWIAAAGPAMLAAELNAARVASASDGYLENANRFIHGYFTRRGFEISEEDVSRHRLSEMHRFSGTPLAAITAAAKWIDPSARAFSTGREDAVEAWAHRDYEKAVQLDPDFGAAWLAWTESLVQQRDSGQAMVVAERALERPALQSDLDRARLQLIAATLHQDESQRAAALAKIAKLTNDPAVTLALAEAQVNARRFPEAISAFHSALAANPTNAAARLSLGYAQAYAGQLAAARETLEAYGKQPGQKTNSLDSLGEACFMNGQFADAEKYFLEVTQSDPNFLGGEDSLKAAYAHWLTGDVKAADAMAAKALHDPLGEARWYFSTGRRDLAVAKLKDVADRQLADHQLAAWNASLPTDLAALKLRYERTPPASDGEIRTLYAAALVAAGQKQEARKLVERWPVPLERGTDPFLDSRVFPRFLETRRALQ